LDSNTLISNIQTVTSPKKTKSITFRLDTMVINELQREADGAEISLNVLVNQVLRRYIEWDRFENRLGMVPIPKSILCSLVDQTMEVAMKAKITDTEAYRDKIVKHTAESALNVMKDTVMFMRNDYNFWSVLDVLRTYMKVAGITSDHRVEAGRKHVFIIKHDLGKTWSLFAKELLLMIFAELANVKAEISATDKTVKAEVNL
jgi:hypothetical protein